MPGLFDLPSELLFQIIHLVLSAPLSISPNVSRHRPKWGYTGRNVTYLPHPAGGIVPSPNALNLLLASQRLHSETRLYLSKQPQSLKLDVAIVNNNWVWPTWRTIPIRSRCRMIDKVEIELILCCTEDERHLQTEWRERGSHHVTDFTTLELVSLLRHLILLEEPQVTHINTISIIIDTTRYGSGNQTISKEDIPLRTMNGLAHLCFDTLYPIDKENSMDFLDVLCWRTGTMLDDLHMPLSKLASHRIGHVSFHIDGQVLMSLNVDDKSAHMYTQ